MRLLPGNAAAGTAFSRGTAFFPKAAEAAGNTDCPPRGEGRRCGKKLRAGARPGRVHISCSLFLLPPAPVWRTDGRGQAGRGQKRRKACQGAWYSHGLPMGAQVEALTRKTQ